MLLLNLKRVESTLNRGGACNGYGAAAGVTAPRGARMTLSSTSCMCCSAAESDPDLRAGSARVI